jgi:hypothetical protein
MPNYRGNCPKREALPSGNRLYRRSGSSMRHIPKNRAVLILALPCLVTLAGIAARAQEPSLAETLAWMDSTYNPHEKTADPGGTEGRKFSARVSLLNDEAQPSAITDAT